MIIRTEKENDRDAVYAINESAFETPSEYNKADEPDGKNLGPFPLYSWTSVTVKPPAGYPQRLGPLNKNIGSKQHE